MKFLRTKLFLLFALILLCTSLTFSQNFLQKADENPLSTAFYLLSTTEKDSKEDEKICLAKSFAKISKAEESRKTAEMFENGSYADDGLIPIVNILIENNKLKEANDFASYLITRFNNDSYRLKRLWNSLIILKREPEAVKIADQFDNSDKIEAFFAMAEAYLNQKNLQKSLELIEKILPLVEKSKYSRDKAQISLFYAKLGKAALSLKFAEQSLKNVAWKTGIMEFGDAVIVDDVFKGYLILGKYELANEILEKQGKTKDSGRLIEIAESYLEKGDRKKTYEFLYASEKILNFKEYNDSFDLGYLVENYLKLGNVKEAERIAKNLSGSDHMQQEQLLHIADFYIKKKNLSKAYEILNYAFEQTKKIDISEKESGLLSTSNKWQQAQYQSRIALRFINIKSDNAALEVISQLKKPYLRASVLTEFVAASKQRLPPAKLSSHLEEALSLLRQKEVDVFDSQKFDVLAVAARNFAEIGMKERSTEVFAEILLNLDKKITEEGSDNSLLYALCNIGVEFDKSQINSNEKIKKSLRQIIKSWENDKY
jgi:hypothetical protein